MERQIVVPLDGSVLAEAALPHAVALARSSGSTLRLLRTVTPAVVLPSLAWPMPAPVNVDRLVESEHKSAQEYLELIAGELRASGLAVATTVVEGHPAGILLRLVEEVPNIREIVMASHGRRGMERWVFGSVAEKVVHSTPVPVLVVPVHHDEVPAEIAQPRQPLDLNLSYTTIMVPLDGSPFAEQALWPARRLAERCHAGLVLVSVLPFLDDIGLGEAGIAPLWTISDQQSARQAVTDYLEETVQRLAKEGVTARSRWVEGPPAEMITATAGEERADLIVMATHGRSGLSKLWLGSVANRVIQRTDLPVLLIRAQEERARAR